MTCQYDTVYWKPAEYITLSYNQDDHSPDNVKVPDISLTVRGTRPQHSAY